MTDLNRDMLSDALDEIQDAYISEAADVPKGKRKWIPAAAGICLLLGGLAVYRMVKLAPAPSGGDSFYEDSALAVMESSVEKSALITEESVGTGDEAKRGGGVFIPAMELPKQTEAMMADMIGFVVYHGGIYTQAANYYDGDAENIDSLVGAYLGYATGSINECTAQGIAQEEYEKEFAGSIEGELYEVKGYDADFRICWRRIVEGADGKPTLYIQFLDRLNGITLATGSDLFEDRLHVRDRVERFRCQSHEDWDWAGGGIYDLEIEQSVWNDFLNEVDQGEFVFVHDTMPDFYRTQGQAHLYLAMDDGTTIGLRLFEDGYVGYDALGWYFVRVEGDIFDVMYEICGGTHGGSQGL